MAARRYLDEAEAIAPSLDDFPATIELLLSQSIHAIYTGDVETVTTLSLEGVTLSREAGDLYQLENMFRNLGVAGMMSGDLHASNTWFVEALQVARRVDNRLGQYYGLSAAGWYAATVGRARVAARAARRGRRAAHADRWRAWRTDDSICRGRAASGTGSVGSSGRSTPPSRPVNT